MCFLKYDWILVQNMEFIVSVELKNTIAGKNNSGLKVERAVLRLKHYTKHLKAGFTKCTDKVSPQSIEAAPIA